MDITSNELGLLPYYIVGAFVVVLFLLLVAFILNNKRAARIEAVLDEMQERMVQSDIALADVDKSLDELFAKRPGKATPTDLQDITFVDEQGQTRNLKETITSLQEQIAAIGAEQQRYYESIIQEQQGLVQSIASLNELMSSLQSERSVSVSAAPTKDDSQEQSFAAAEQAFNQVSQGGIFMPPGQELESDASFAQTASDIAKLVAKTDFSAIDPHSAPETIGEHMQKAERKTNSSLRPEKAPAIAKTKAFRGRDPMNPLGIAGTFEPSDTFNNTSNFGTNNVLQENPTPGLPSGGAEEFIELTIDKPASPSDPQLSSLDEQISNLDGFELDANDDLVIPEGSSLGMPDSSLEHNLVNELSQDLASLDKALGEISERSTPQKDSSFSSAPERSTKVQERESFSALESSLPEPIYDEDKEQSLASEIKPNKTHLTIDYSSSDSLDNLDNLKVAVNHEMSVAMPKQDIKGDLSEFNAQYTKITSTAPAPVVDMIYDHDYVQQQKERPNGINIDTLDKAKTFIEAGVSLTEISAKTGLSEDEIRLIYDVDADGKIKDHAEQFNKEVAKLEDEDTSTKIEPAHAPNDDVMASEKKNVSKVALSLDAASPASALDKDERQEIESMMQEINDPFLAEMKESAQELPELSQEADFKAAVEQNKLERERALDEVNLEAIDRLADSIISENEQKGLLRRNESEDPLNVLGDFQHKTGSSMAALAQSIKNTSEEYLADDNVTLTHHNEQKVKANRQKVSSLASSKEAPSQAAYASMQAQQYEQARKNNIRNQSAIGAIGSATSSQASSRPLSLGAIENKVPRAASTNFSAVSAMNPGMADVVSMAPMALGSIEGGKEALGAMEDEDPAAILNQVVKGGLNSVASLSSDQLDTLNQLQSSAMPAQSNKQHFANYQARNAYGIKRR